MFRYTSIFAIVIFSLISMRCSYETETDNPNLKSDSVIVVSSNESVEDTIIPMLEEKDIILIKDLMYDKYTLRDTYTYKDTLRSFKWNTIRRTLAFIENVQNPNIKWVVMQNYKNKNKYPPLVKKYIYNSSALVSDTLGTSRYQSVPLYSLNDTLSPELYAPDGSIAILNEDYGSFVRVKPLLIDNEWLVPLNYVRILNDTTFFTHVIVIDRKDQNIASLEYADRGIWKIRSMNPATTGIHNPPYAQETPLGIFLVQEKKKNMYFLKDGTKEIGGYAPWASRFTNGAHIHGVPVNKPMTKPIEYSWSLGTVPRSHMCVRNATSHAKFIYDWAPSWSSLVVVLE